LTERGLNWDHIRRYGIGYAPDSWRFLTVKLTGKQYDASLLHEAGLTIPNKEGTGYHDRFRNRIMFPIHEQREGKVVAFGGRTLGDDPAKYINTPETVIYRKSHILYGMWEGLQSIRKTREVIIVEGYFDRIALDRAGIHHCVAPCGTALTPQQIGLVKRAALKIIRVFDPDEAGRSAAKRALELCLAAGVDTLAVPLPDGLDPDDILRNQGVDGLRKVIDTGLTAMDYIIDSARSGYSLELPHHRKRFVDDMIPFLVSVENSIDQGTYIRRISELMRVPDSSIINSIREFQSRRNRQHRAGNSMPEPIPAPSKLLDTRERDFLMLLLSFPETVSISQQYLRPEDLISELGSDLYRNLLSIKIDSDRHFFSKFLDRLTSEDARTVVTEIAMDEDVKSRLVKQNPEVILKNLAGDFRKCHIRKELTQSKQKIRDDSLNEDQIKELLEKQMRLMKELDELN